MTSLNTPAADKGVLSHGEEFEAMNNALHGYLTAKPKDACPWQGYDNCRNCGLYEKCFKLEASVKPENFIDLGNSICQSIEELSDKARRLGIIGEANHD